MYQWNNSNTQIVFHHYRIFLCWIEEFFIAHHFNKNNSCAYVCAIYSYK